MPDALVQGPIATPGGGEHAEQAAAREDRHRQQPVHAKLAHTVRVAGGDLGRVTRSGGRSDRADQPLGKPWPAPIRVPLPRRDQLAIRPCGRLGHQSPLGIVDDEHQRRPAEQGRSTARDRIERCAPVERRAEVAAKAAELLALTDLLALMLLLCDLLAQAGVVGGSADDDAAEQPRDHAEADEVADAHRQQVEARVVAGTAHDHHGGVHAAHDQRRPQRRAEPETERRRQDHEPVEEVHVDGIGRDIDRHGDRRHVDHRADDPDLARRESAEQPRHQQAPGRDERDHDEQGRAAGKLRHDERQQQRAHDGHPEAHRRELALLGAHLLLEVTLELDWTVASRFHAQRCTLASAPGASVHSGASQADATRPRSGASTRDFLAPTIPRGR